MLIRNHLCKSLLKGRTFCTDSRIPTNREEFISSVRTVFNLLDKAKTGRASSSAITSYLNGLGFDLQRDPRFETLCEALCVQPRGLSNNNESSVSTRVNSDWNLNELTQ